MSLARSLERRIEHLVEGLGSKVFRGRLHPVEVAIRIVREAEMSLTQSGVGPTAPNEFVVSINPADLGDDADQVVSRLCLVIDEAARERGWRMEGPPMVTLHASPEVTAGSVDVTATTRTGAMDPWGQLIEAHGSRRMALGKNRSLVGRSRRADIMLGDDTVSRAHSLLWFDSGGCWIQDLASSNGTSLNGQPVREATSLRDGDLVGFGQTRFSFRRA
ncbi:MAG: FhaA domain-containing protein [Acidimicrobiia bacterium]